MTNLKHWMKYTFRRNSFLGTPNEIWPLSDPPPSYPKVIFLLKNKEYPAFSGLIRISLGTNPDPYFLEDWIRIRIASTVGFGFSPSYPNLHPYVT